MKLKIIIKIDHIINIPRPRYEHKHTKCIIPISNKQHLSNIWGSIYKKVKKHWGWVEKMCCLLKKCV